MGIHIEFPEDFDTGNGWSDEDVRGLWAGYQRALKSLTFVDHCVEWRIRFHEGNVLTEWQGTDWAGNPFSNVWSPEGVFPTDPAEENQESYA